MRSSNFRTSKRICTGKTNNGPTTSSISIYLMQEYVDTYDKEALLVLLDIWRKHLTAMLMGIPQKSDGQNRAEIGNQEMNRHNIQREKTTNQANKDERTEKSSI